MEAMRRRISIGRLSSTKGPEVMIILLDRERHNVRRIRGSKERGDGIKAKIGSGLRCSFGSDSVRVAYSVKCKMARRSVRLISCRRNT